MDTRMMIAALALLLALPAAQAQKIMAGQWLVNAELRGGVQISGSVSGPRCKLLRLDIFTTDDGGHTGHVVAMVRDVGQNRKFFSAADRVWGANRNPQMISAYPSCRE